MAKNHEPNLLLEKSMKKSKTPNPSSKRKKPAKKRVRWQDEYLCMWSFKLKPVCEEYLEKIGEDFIAWCRQARIQKPDERDRFSLERFCEDKGIPLDTLKEWRKRSKKLNECIKSGKLMLGNMIEEGLLKKRYSEKGSMFVLHNYLDRYEKDNKYHQDLKNIKDAVAQLLGATFELPELEGKE